MKTRNKVKLCLRVMEIGRLNMINSFTSYEPELYLPIVYSAISSEVEKLSIEKVQLMWLNFHWKVLQLLTEENNLSENNQEILYTFFAKYFQNLISKYIKGNKDENSELFIKLIYGKITVISKMINVGIKHSNYKNQLILQYETEKLLYNSVLTKIKDRYGKTT